MTSALLRNKIYYQETQTMLQKHHCFGFANSSSHLLLLLFCNLLPKRRKISLAYTIWTFSSIPGRPLQLYQTVYLGKKLASEQLQPVERKKKLKIQLLKKYWRNILELTFFKTQIHIQNKQDKILALQLHPKIILLVYQTFAIVFFNQQNPKPDLFFLPTAFLSFNYLCQICDIIFLLLMSIFLIMKVSQVQFMLRLKKPMTFWCPKE